MSALRIFSGVFAGFLLVTAPLGAFATSVSQIGTRKPAYLTGNPSLDKMFADYEASVRTRGDAEKLRGFLNESSAFRNRGISEALRDDLLKVRLDSVRKSDLSKDVSMDSVVESGRKGALS